MKQLYDVDNNPIYEGDIVTLGCSTQQYVVIVHNGQYRLILKDWYSQNYHESSISTLNPLCWGLIVVGSIYDG